MFDNITIMTMILFLFLCSTFSCCFNCFVVLPAMLCCFPYSTQRTTQSTHTSIRAYNKCISMRFCVLLFKCRSASHKRQEAIKWYLYNTSVKKKNCCSSVDSWKSGCTLGLDISNDNAHVQNIKWIFKKKKNLAKGNECL